MTLALEIDRRFNASPERLYSVWTDSEHLSRWFGVRVDTQPRIDGPITFHFGESDGPIQGRYLALRPHSYIAFTWEGGCGKNEVRNTTVHINFEPEGEGTRLRLRHEGFLTQEAFDSHDEGWLVYMELWGMLINAGPENTTRATIAETFSSKVDVPAAVATWLGRSPAELSIERENASSIRIKATPKGTSTTVEAQIVPCRFGQCVSLVEWGLKGESDRVATRNTWVKRFADLRTASKSRG